MSKRSGAIGLGSTVSHSDLLCQLWAAAIAHMPGPNQYMAGTMYLMQGRSLFASTLKSCDRIRDGRCGQDRILIHFSPSWPGCSQHRRPEAQALLY